MYCYPLGAAAVARQSRVTDAKALRATLHFLALTDFAQYDQDAVRRTRAACRARLYELVDMRTVLLDYLLRERIALLDADKRLAHELNARDVF